MAPPAIPPADEEPPFALLRPWRPISSQASPKSRAAYRRDVRHDAGQAFAGRSPLGGPLYARVVYLHRGPSTQDVDNFLKPTLDALKGLVYADDHAIGQCLAERIRGENITISARRQPPGIVERLLDLLAADVPHITYIEVGHAAEQLLWFGPIREEAG